MINTWTRAKSATFILVAVGAAVALAAACSGSSGGPGGSGGGTCGPGTVLAKGECIVASNDATPADVAGSAEDGAPPADATAQDSQVSDGTAIRSADSLAVDAESASDPCPTDAAVPIDCDPACGDASATCMAAGCAKMAATSLPVRSLPYVIRTPNAPGTDPACASQCPGGGFAYGLGFTIPAVYARASFTVSVEAPWTVISDAPQVSVGQPATTPYCDVPDADVDSNCVSFGLNSSGSIYVMTKDPNAPARNISIQVLPINSTPAGCPYR